MEDSLVFEGNDLPVEIVITIFEYLSITDIKNASITCKNWFNASMHYSVMDRRVLFYLIDDNLKKEDFKILKPSLSYNNVKISHHTTSDNNKPKRLTVLFEFLNQLENLSSLNIIFSDDHGSDRRCWYDSSYMNQKSCNELKSLKSVKVFKIGMYYLTKSCWLPYFLDLMPELEHIDITSLQQCKSCTGKSLYDYLTNGKNRIKSLNLHTSNEQNKLELISTIKGMNLTTLTISTDSIDSYLNFTDPDKLLHLYLSWVSNINIDLIANTFPNLETLAIKSCNDINGITKFKKLKEFMVYGHFGDDVINNPSEYKFNVLERLNLKVIRKSKIPFPFKNLTNLTHISLDNVVVIDPQMQEVCQHLKHLRHFALKAWPSQLTDFGFTGEEGNSETGYSISNLKHLNLLHIDIEYGSLGDPTLLHIMKIRQLEYLYITCDNNRVMDLKKSINDLKESCPLLSKRAEINVLGIKYEIMPIMPKMRSFSKLYPLTNFIAAESGQLI